MDAGINHGSGAERLQERDGGKRMKSERSWWSVVGDQLGLVVVLIILILAFGLTTPYFLTATTFTTIANQIPATVLVTVGMTYVLVIAGIDLSVGSVLGLCGGVVDSVVCGDAGDAGDRARCGAPGDEVAQRLHRQPGGDDRGCDFSTFTI